ELFSKAEIIPVIPDLRDPPVREAKDVRGGEADPSAAWLNAAPRSGMAARGRPAANNKVPLPDDQIDCELKAGERGTKVISDLLLSGRTRQRLGLAEIVADVVIREDLKRKIAIASIPDLLVEATDEGL